jgi:hypothetical protein
MASILQRVAKRAAYPVETGCGTLYVCEPTFRDIDRVQRLKNSSSLSLALMLVTEDGRPLVPQGDGESDQAYADRMKEEVAELTPSDMRKLTEAVERMIKPIDPGDLAKNS